MTGIPFYEERQANPPWMGWLLVFAGVGLLVFLGMLFMNRYEAASGVWTDDLSGLAGAAAGSSIAVGVAAWLIFINRLEVTISDEGIRYMFVPAFWKSRLVPSSSILSYELRNMGFWEFVSSQRKLRSRLWHSQKLEVCVIRSFKVVDLTLVDGRHLLLGTKNAEGMNWALRKLKGVA